jgi:hypothetical protein
LRQNFEVGEGCGLIIFEILIERDQKLFILGNCSLPHTLLNTPIEKARV